MADRDRPRGQDSADPCAQARTACGPAFLSRGAPKLKKIDVNNDKYYSQGNCLITRIGNELHLGCRQSKIPDQVWYIHKNAFSRCEIKKIVIPDSVKEIAPYAFLYCDQLEDVVLGTGLFYLRENAFYKCFSIKTIHIKNKAMEVGRELYNQKAFTVSVRFGGRSCRKFSYKTGS